MKRECQVKKNEHFRHLLLFAFNQGSKAAKAARDICAVYGEDAISKRTARDWYAKFKNGHFDLKDAPRSGRRVEFDEERLKQLLCENSRQTTRELAEKMECSHTTIEKHLHSMGKIQKCGAGVPHASLQCKSTLEEKNKIGIQHEVSKKETLEWFQQKVDVVTLSGK